MQKSTTILAVLQMLEDGFSYRDIRARHQLGNSSITLIKKRFNDLDISLKDLISMNEKSIQDLFYPSHLSAPVRPLPDFSKIYRELTDRSHRTNLYFIWLRYKKDHPDGYQYTQFKHYFKNWLNDHHLEDQVRMVVERIPGEIMYIDWAGDTLELVATEETGVLQKAHFFITTIGVSSYCFAMAFPNEKTENFLQGTVHALHFYGGTPKILKPDNTKAASIKNTKDVLILNSAYADLQDYYKVVVVPAPPGKPRGIMWNL